VIIVVISVSYLLLLERPANRRTNPENKKRAVKTARPG